jgi:putative membrane protein
LRFLVIRRQIERSDAGRSMFGAIEVLFSSMLAVLLLTVFVFLLGLARGG